MAAAKNPVTAGANRAAAAMVSKLLPFTPPWLLAGTTYAAANVAHHAWANQPGPVMAATLASAALTAGTAKVAPDGAPMWRWHATVTCALATGAMPLSAALDPGAPGAMSAWAILGVGTALSWNIRKLTRNGGADGPKALPSGTDLFDKVNRLKGTTVQSATIDGHRLTATLGLPPGEVTVEDVQGARKHIASALGIHARGITVREDDERGDRAHLSIVVKDLLKDPIAWPGPSRPGACISEPIRYGIYEDGQPAEFWLPGEPGGKGRQPRPVTHFLISGMTGAGKGETTIDVVAEVATRRRVVMWIGDPGKGSQTLQDVAGAFEWVAIGTARTLAMISSLPDVITARADQLGRWGYKQWVPEVYDKHGMPFLCVFVEEASRVLRGNEAWVTAGQEARSAGVALLASAQVFDHTVIPRKSRGQFPGGLIHGQGEDIDANYVTPDALTEAGADPVRWGNTCPGKNYLVAPGIPEARWPIPIRSYMSDPAKLRKVIAVHKNLRAVSDLVTARAAGAAFANRHNPIGLKEAVADARAESREKAADMDDTPTGPTEEQRDAPVEFEPRPDTEDLGTVDVDQEIPPTGRPAVSIGEANPFRRDRATSVATLEARIEELRIEGRSGFAPNDLAETVTAVGRKRPWVMGELARLVEEGRLTKPEPGTYRWTDHWQTVSELVTAP
ncbi:hypothetical protein [Embleya sp. NPDC001921]